MPSAKLGHWGKAKKARTPSTISQYHPTPPTKTVGGGGRISREICRFFAFRAIIWRRGVEFPEKNAGSHVFEPSFGGGGSPGGGANRLVATLNHTGFQITYLRAVP